MEQQQRIEKAIKEKQERINKAIASREKSIAYFNSVNSAIALVERTSQARSQKELKGDIQYWRDWFYQQWQEWYLENMPIERTKLTPQDFAEAKKEAPEQQAKQELAETLEEGAVKEEEKIKRSEAEDEYFSIPPQSQDV